MVRRIPGISLSPNEYWELDTFTTRKLLDLEQEIIDKELEGSKDKENEYSEYSDKDDVEMISLIEEMQE